MTFSINSVGQTETSALMPSLGNHATK